MKRRSLLVGSGVWLAATAFSAKAADRLAAMVSPSHAGFDPNLPNRMKAALDAYIKDNQIPGGVIVVARHGKIVATESAGLANVAQGIPAGPNIIYPLFSVSKVPTAVGAMILVEDKAIGLDDPITKTLPEFKSLRVYVSGHGNDVVTEPLKRPVMIRDLLTMRGGFVYGNGKDKSSVYWDFIKRGLNISATSGEAKSLDDYIARLAEMPLLFQPGTRWEYSPGADILGAIIQRVSGMPFDQFMQKRLFARLGMNDTGFHVDPAKKNRYALVYSRDSSANKLVAPDNRRLATVGDGDTMNFVPAGPDPEHLPAEAPMLSGAAGLLSTADDMAVFTMMLANGGIYQGTRILKLETVAAMHVVTGEVGEVERNVAGYGSWGVGVAVQADPSATKSLGPVGTFGWQGAGSSEIWIDSATGISAVLMTNRFGGRLPEVPKAVFGALRAG